MIKINKDLIMGRILGICLVLVFVGLIGLTGFVYLGDMAPRQQTVTLPVTLDVQ